MELRRDREVVLAAVRQRGDALLYAAEELRHDRQVVLAAVEQTKWALQYAPEQLKHDPKVVLAAVKNCGGALRFASEELRKDAFLKEWASLSTRGRRNRRAREAFLRTHSERDAKVQAKVDLWLIRNDQVDALSAKRRRVRCV